MIVRLSPIRRTREVLSTVWLSLAAAGILTYPNRLLAVAWVLIVLAGWLWFSIRRPHLAFIALVLVTVVHPHVFAVAYRWGAPAGPLRVILAAKDAFAILLALAVSWRAVIEGRHAVLSRLVLASTPVMVFSAVAFATSYGVPLLARIIGLRGLVTPVAAVVAGALLPAAPGKLVDRWLLTIIVGGTIYALIEYTLPRDYLTEVLGIGEYWREVKGQGGFLIGDLPGNFFSGSGLRRLSGGFGDPLTAGYVIAAGFVVAMKEGAKYQWARVVAAAGLVLTLSRVAWVIAALVVIAAFSGEWFRPRRVVSLVVMAMVPLTFVVAMSPLRGFLADTANLTDASSVGHRLALEENLSREYSVAGQGLGAGGAAVASGELVEGAVGTESSYFTVLIQLGWLGLVCYLWFVLGVGMHILREGVGFARRHRARVGLLLGIAVSGFFSEQSLTFNTGYIAWSLVAWRGETVNDVPASERTPGLAAARRDMARRLTPLRYHLPSLRVAR